MPSQAVFHLERLMSVEVLKVVIHAALKVLGVNPFGPAIADLLGQGPAREGQPPLVEVVAEGVGAGPPDQDGRLLHQQRIFRQRKMRLSTIHNQLQKIGALSDISWWP